MNLGLLFVVNRYSSRHVGPYKTVIRMTCFNDISMSFFDLLGQLVILADEGKWVLFSNGVFANKYPWLDFWLVIGVTSSFYINALCLPVQYYYRYLAVQGKVPLTRGSLAKILSVVLSFVVIGLTATYFMLNADRDFQQSAVGILRSTGWSPNASLDCAPFLFGGELGETREILYFLIIGGVSSGGYVVVIITELKVARTLKGLGSLMNEQTRRVHKEFKKALLGLAVCPLIGLVLPVSYNIFVVLFRYNSGISTAYATTMCTSIALLNPLITVLIVKPYRNAIVGWFTRPMGAAVDFVSRTTTKVNTVYHASTRLT
ncbi:hypothetical protein AAVH_13965 [Aphelenchoides avenae]|nr:hypothetical protein AAVH_13965 [Aphelenchus avenae]